MFRRLSGRYWGFVPPLNLNPNPCMSSSPTRRPNSKRKESESRLGKVFLVKQDIEIVSGECGKMHNCVGEAKNLEHTGFFQDWLKVSKFICHRFHSCSLKDSCYMIYLTPAKTSETPCNLIICQSTVKSALSKHFCFLKRLFYTKKQ
jgi:hypothetical protein